MNVPKIQKIGGLFLAAAIVISTSSSIALAQNDSGAKQSMKDAGTETKDAAKDAGHGIKQGTKKAYHKTKSEVKKAHRKMDPDTPKN